MSDDPVTETSQSILHEAEEDGMDEFETPVHVPSIVDQALLDRERAEKDAKMAAARDPLERQQAKDKIDFAARRKLRKE